MGDTRCWLLANSSDPPIEPLLAPLLEHPERAALLCDVDGTLAPIERLPEQACVPERARELLSELGRRYALVVCVSGRRATDARSVVGVSSIAYVGNHGLEYLPPGAQIAETPPLLQEWAGRVRAFALDALDEQLRALGVRLEDKLSIWSFHWRELPDESAAREAMERVASAATGQGLRAHWGRKVLEIRPPLDFDKGTAVEAVLAHTHVGAALYVGDDRTDLDVFRKLRELKDRGTLEHALCVGVRSAEGPEEIAGEADLVLEGPGDVVELLAALRPR